MRGAVPLLQSVSSLASAIDNELSIVERADWPWSKPVAYTLV
jgi:hypothetical protein